MHLQPCPDILLIHFAHQPDSRGHSLSNLKIAWARANGPPLYAYVDCELELTCFESSEMYQMVAQGHVQVKRRFEDLGVFLKLSC